MSARYRPVVLCILDGWGIAPDGPGNAVTRADTPRLDALLARYPYAKLDASGRAVGLPDGVMGNSEVGHLTMGAGYIQYQEFVRINDAIDDGSFFDNAALRAACAAARDRGTLHLMGLISTGGVHADMKHLAALVDLAKRERVGRVVVHAFLDGREKPFAGEDRTLVSSPKVATYDQQPEMSARGVADTLVAAIQSGTYDFAIVNFANPDMVGHTGDIEATRAALAVTDEAVGRIVDAAVAAGGCVIVTADHGNAEEMLFPDGGRNTQHSTNPVPVIFVARDGDRYSIGDGGLRDIAPTLLTLLGLPVPERITGRSLLTRKG